MIGELVKIAGQCDGVRCDMAMLVLRDCFQQLWYPLLPQSEFDQKIPGEFWDQAIEAVRRVNPDFKFIAEAYWDMEWTLQQQGFDFCYDKRLYDRIVGRDVAGVRGHLRAELAYQSRLVRFLENHDEPRAAATFSSDVHEAAAVITFLSPGLRFFHQGQFFTIPPETMHPPASTESIAWPRRSASSKANLVGGSE